MKLEITQNKDRPEKKHKFGYIEKHSFEVKENYNTLDVKSMIKHELNLITELGCSKKSIINF